MRDGHWRAAHPLSVPPMQIPCRPSCQPATRLKRAAAMRLLPITQHRARETQEHIYREVFTELVENITFTAAELNCWVTNV